MQENGLTYIYPFKIVFCIAITSKDSIDDQRILNKTPREYVNNRFALAHCFCFQ